MRQIDLVLRKIDHCVVIGILFAMRITKFINDFFSRIYAKENKSVK